MVEQGDYGPVLILRGRHKGTVGYYDDDDDGAIVYLGAPFEVLSKGVDRCVGPAPRHLRISAGRDAPCAPGVVAGRLCKSAPRRGRFLAKAP
jgi:hypothetical protein